ncbi:hypothetical protein [Nocardioides jensenii]|uniref:hypothetical protein n=1 Tax=Nocardioides jensenii TaxID=1843 RepID=UPI00082EFCEF|nr:hypothetical protein [Nocardioides jensenii]
MSEVEYVEEPDDEALGPSVVMDRDTVEMLAGVVATLQGHIWAGTVAPSDVRRLARKFVEAGRLDEDWTEQQLRSRLEDLIFAMQFALGRIDELPGPATSPVRDPEDGRERGL